MFGQNAFFLQNTSQNCFTLLKLHYRQNRLIIQKESISFDHVWNFINTYKTTISIKNEQLFYDTFRIESQ